MTGSRPLVSVIIINYNTFDLTVRCIKSIEERSRYEPIEVIVVDNASLDDVDQLKGIFPYVKLIKSKVNLGFAKGNNLGIEASEGEIILLLNSDTELLNDAIDVCVELITSDRNIAVVAPKLLYPNGTVQHNCQRFPSIRFRLFELFRLQKIFPRIGKRLLLGSFFDYNSIVEVDWVWGTFFMFRRSLLSSLKENKLDDSFFMYCEDMEWCMQFKKMGYKITYTPKAEVLHHLGMSKGKKNAFITENTRAFMGKHYSALRLGVIHFLDNCLRTTIGWK
jgi:GT2 family glycosyltransferase